MHFETGDTLPEIVGPCSNGNDRFHFTNIAGPYLILSFFDSLQAPGVRPLLENVYANIGAFRQAYQTRFIGVSTDPRDAEDPLCKGKNQDTAFIWDFDREISQRFGCYDDPNEFKAFTLVLDPSQRIIEVIPFYPIEKQLERILWHLAHMPPPELHAGPPMHAPILILPRLFSGDFCQYLIKYYHSHPQSDSGFMNQVGDKTIYDSGAHHKKRRDCTIDERPVVEYIKQTLERKLFPQVYRAFQFQPTHIERYIVACYNAETGGYFHPHRDNTTKGTAHRRFAVSINLNAEDYEGGDLCFPQFGPQRYRAPTGGAVVFSCSMLHQCTPMIRGTRYCMLPFLYDDSGAALRKENLQYLERKQE